MGRGTERVYVNTATGNLIVQSADETLSALGLDFAGLRTYNSQGLLDDDNGDNWRLGVHRRLSNATGTVNTAGSTITKTFGDGASIVYGYNVARARYESTEGDGAHDHLTFSAGAWTWTDGSARNTETYDSSLRCVSASDVDGNTIVYHYTGSMLTSLEMAGNAAQTVHFEYTGVNLAAIRVESDGATQHLTRYQYDVQDRLETVTVDLSPDDDSVTDGATYTTTYTYEGASRRIASITQKDGSSVAFTYQLVDGEYRVHTVTDGANRVTTFAYSEVAQGPGGPPTSSGWENALLLESSNLETMRPRIAFDANGNGIAVWTEEGGYLYARRFNKATDTWGPATELQEQLTETFASIDPISLDVDDNGNAVVAWATNDDDLEQYALYVSRYDAAEDTWGGPELVRNSPRTFWHGLSVATVGSSAAVAWADMAANGIIDLRVARWTAANGWNYAALVESAVASVVSGATVNPSVAVDGQGRISVAWQQAGNVYVNRFDGAAWTGTALLETAAASASDVKLKFDGAGNGIAVWNQGTDLLARRYDAATDAWGVQTALDTGSAGIYWSSLSVDASGDAVVGWSQSDGTAISVFGSRYSSASNSWSTAAALESANEIAGVQALAADISGSHAVVSWVQQSGASGLNAHAARWDGTSWTTERVVIGGTSDFVVDLSAAIDAQGNATVLAAHFDGVVGSLYALRYGVGSAGGGPAIYQRTDIEDSLGFVATMHNDSAGRLTRTQSAQVNGARLDTRYEYDADGNLTSVIEDPDGLDRVTAMTYDAHGNLLTSRDAAGNAIARTYSSSNQLLTETRYLVPDPDGAGAQVATVPVTSRFAYDAEDHLRFAVSAEGRVTEHRYNLAGQRVATLMYRGARFDLTGLATNADISEATLANWATNQDLTTLLRTDFAYDFRGTLETTTTYSATDASGNGMGVASTTRFVYDQRGRLLTTIEARGTATTADPDDHVTSFTYDGLGRVLTATSWVDDDTQHTTITNYDDVSRRTTVTLANGLVTTSTFNHAGELTSVAQGVSGVLGTTHHAYDANGRLRMVTDPVGARTFRFYDDVGRLVATVDADGTLTELVYDRTSAVVKTIQYAERLDTGTLDSLVSAGIPQDVPLATLRAAADGIPADDRIARNVYDPAGRLVLAIDAVGAVTQLFYDGAGRLTDEVRFSTPVTIARELDALEVDDVTVTSTPEDRRMRHFHDADGNEVATLDAAGYLVEYVRDPAGLLVAQIGYATQTAAQYWVGGTLEQLRPGASDDDVRSRFFHDAQGRQIGVLDAEQYLTEQVYDVAGHLVSTTRYDVVLDDPTHAATFADLRGAALAAVNAPVDPAVAHTTTFEYDGRGLVTREVNFEGCIATFGYDEVGKLIRSTRALGTSEARTTATRHDELGHVTHELSAEGSASITPGMSQAEIDAIWSKYGVRYEYDIAGRRISATRRPDDLHTDKTLFFYDADGRLRFAVNPQGEVTETRYDAFGQATTSVAYVNRIATDGLLGGAIVTALTDRVTAAADPLVDATTTLTYTRRGEVSRAQGAQGADTTSTYDAFGDLHSTEQTLNATQVLRHEYRYDARGQLTLTRWDPSGADVTEVRTYDAFGRTKTVKDARGATTSFEYDRLGRQIEVVDALGGHAFLSYDAFSQTLTSTDRNGAVTTFEYDDALRSMTTTTPEDVSIVTVHDHHGQTLRVTRAGLTTQFIYDRNGNLLDSFDNLGSRGSSEYDRANRVIATTAANGTVTTLVYDAADRVLTRTVDSDADGLQLVTEYTYDGLGRVTLTEEPGGRVTETRYDREGRVTDVIVDPEGFALRTHFVYDLAGRRIETIDGYETAMARRTVTVFDPLGRRVSDTIDPAEEANEFEGLHLVTEYRYDASGNVTRKIDPAGHSTWFVYDALGRVRFTVDALGGVSELTYDAEGRVVATRRYATPVDPYLENEEFGDELALDDVANLLTTSVHDRISRSVYDRDGREVYTIDGLGGVTERTFDDNGNVTRTRLYANPIADGEYQTVDAVRDALDDADNDVEVLASADRVSWMAYDLRGRPTFAMDGLGAVTRSEYDVADNVVRSTAFATLRDPNLPVSHAELQNWALGSVVANDAATRVTRYWYDALDRLRFTLDAEGFLTEMRYDDGARIEKAIAYAEAAPPILVGATLAEVAGVAADLADPAADHLTETRRDVVGRVRRVYDAAGKFEEYGYDAVGNRTSLTNKLGNVWTYEYDKNHRLVTEITPVVEIARTTSRTVFEPIRSAVLDTQTATASLITRIEYSALGDVLSRTEASGRVEQRRTSYEYDALGRQVATILPEVGYYDAEGEQIYNSHDRRLVQRSQMEQRDNLYTTTTYDTLGNAVSNTDVGGGETEHIHDRLGRLRYTIDAEFGVTELRYDVFGNQVELVRYANPLFDDIEESFSITADNIAEVLVPDAANDRVVTTEYDRVNRAVRLQEPETLVFEPNAGAPGGQVFAARPTVVTSYDAFGQAVKQSRLVNPQQSLWADTYHYYDERGLCVAKVDALGYLTTYEHDAYGNVVESVEFAKALTPGSWSASGHAAGAPTNVTTSPNDAAGYDRVVHWTFDALNRRSSERRIGVTHSTYAAETGLGTGTVDAVTTFFYDALGNLTRTVDEAGGTTYTFYDVLGRQRAVAAPTRSAGSTTVTAMTPLVTMKYDAFGNLVEQRVHAAGASAIDENGFTTTNNMISDRVSKSLFDALNRAIQVQDAELNNRFFSYTQRGEIGREWMPNEFSTSAVRDHADATAYVHDRLGRQVRSYRAYEDSFAPVESPPAVNELGIDTRYNTFGEIIERTQPGKLEFSEYDRSGRVVRTNSGDGVTKVFLYNLAGQITAEIRSATRDLRSLSIEEVAALATERMRTETRYDLAGRVLEQRMPSFGVATNEGGLQAFGALLRVDANVLAPNNPDAVFVVVRQEIDYGDNDVHTIESAEIRPEVSVADGGGYMYTAPTAENPGGGWVQDPNYALEPGRYIHWARPPGMVYDNGTHSQVLFEIRPASSGSFVPRRVENLPNGELGVNIGDLADGTYVYRLTYSQFNATQPNAIATGTLTIGAALSLTDTTAATLAGENLVATAVVSEVSLNAAFQDANFRIGDFNGPAALDPFVYRRYVFNGEFKFIVDRLATVADGGGWYRTAAGFVQDADYLPATSRVLHWNAPSDPDLVAQFELAASGSGTLGERAISILAGGIHSVALGDLDDGEYHYRVTYRSLSSPEAPPVAVATGVFRLEPANAGDSVALTPNPPDDAGTVAPVMNRPAGAMNVSAAVIASASFESGSVGGVVFTGQNQVLVTFASFAGPVRVELEYTTAAVEPVEDPGPAEQGWQSQTRRISLVAASAANAASGLQLTWSDPAVATPTGGISEVVSVRVYALDANGDATLRHSTVVGDLATTGGTTLAWKAPWNAAVSATFKIRPTGASTWDTLDVARIAGDFSVDLAMLLPGTWEYEITYLQEGVTRALSTGTLTTHGGAILNAAEPPPGGMYPTEPVAPVTGYFTGELAVTVADSAAHTVTGTPTSGAPSISRGAISAPRTFAWSSTTRPPSAIRSTTRAVARPAGKPRPSTSPACSRAARSRSRAASRAAR